MKQYLTIKADLTTEITIKKSRFIIHLKRITTENDALTFISDIKKLHHKANHSCYAFVLGDQDQIQRASDDGEPIGTAGVPILEVIKRSQIHDICIVVTRYFGGIKLGTGGLIRAYASSAATGIEATGIVERLIMQTIDITIQYNQLDTVTYWLTQNNYADPVITYTDSVTLSLPIKATDYAAFIDKLTNLLHGNVTFIKGDIGYQEIPYRQQDA